MKNYKQIMGTRIKELRKRAGFTQAQLAEILNVDFKYVSRLETGYSTPSFSMLEKMSNALNTELSEFFICEDSYVRENVIARIDKKLSEARLEYLNVIDKLVELVLN